MFVHIILYFIIITLVFIADKNLSLSLSLINHYIEPIRNHFNFFTFDLITPQVLNEFTHGKHEKVSKTEFKEVLSDILLGMAAGLKRDPIVILRIDGEDLLEFLNGSVYEPEIVSIFSQIESPHASLHDLIIQALSKLNVDQGIPPTSDPWVANSYH